MNQLLESGTGLTEGRARQASEQQAHCPSCKRILQKSADGRLSPGDKFNINDFRLCSSASTVLYVHGGGKPSAAMSKLKWNFNGLMAAFVVISGVTIEKTWAIPTLQLDIAGGTYVGGSEESTISNGPVFDLQALVTSSYLALDPGQTYFISAAITPKTTVPLQESFGSFTINGVTYSASSGMQWGRPPVEDAIDTYGDLPTHGIYDTHYAEIAFTFAGADLLAAYNAQDGSSADGTVRRKTFAVDTTGLADGYELHFDLYNTEYIRKKKLNLEVIDEFAPFSHDAASGLGTQVPDGGSTAMLLGAGLAGLSAIRRYAGRK
jgi:hypothetical protein